MGVCHGGQKPVALEKADSGQEPRGGQPLLKDATCPSGGQKPASLEKGDRDQKPGGGQPLLKDATCPSVAIVVYTIGGENILGPKEYPSAITLSQLHTDVLASLADGSLGAGSLQLMHGDRTLGGDDGIAGFSGQQTLSLFCVFRPWSLRANWRAPYRDWVQSWSLDVLPLEDKEQTAVEKWLHADNEGTVQKISGTDILQELSIVKTEVGEEEWTRLEALMQKASPGQCVHITTRANFAPTGGWRAAIAGYGITWIVEKGF